MKIAFKLSILILFINVTNISCKKDIAVTALNTSI